ncbi:PAS domain-containing protein [Kiloniella majae]|uniref:PAS domain-containing protein n=1 Tax=Kiloniella majae TaxID=1938558 RepID=UPI000A27741E|nr:PAS domain-containing protein [Kiloniella majae]
MYQVLDLEEIPENSPVSYMASYYEGLPKLQLKDSDQIPLPQWSDFNPLEVRKILPWTMVIQRDGASPAGHIIKLEGERIIEASGVNSMGQSLAEAFDPDMAEIKWREMEDVAQQRCTSFTLSPVPRSDRSFIDLYRGCFPFCDEQGDVCRLVITVAPVKDIVR